jgi:hypothetical protein
MSEVLSFYPEEISFTDVRVNQTYIQILDITNTTQASLSLRIRPGNSERLSAEPSTFTLGEYPTLPASFLFVRLSVRPFTSFG